MDMKFTSLQRQTNLYGTDGHNMVSFNDNKNKKCFHQREDAEEDNQGEEETKGKVGMG